MRLHNYCIDERDAEWYAPDLPNEAIAEHLASFEEYHDALDATGTSLHGGGRNNVRCVVRDAIRKQLTSLGRERPCHIRK